MVEDASWGSLRVHMVRGNSTCVGGHCHLEQRILLTCVLVISFLLVGGSLPVVGDGRNLKLPGLVLGSVLSLMIGGIVGESPHKIDG